MAQESEINGVSAGGAASNNIAPITVTFEHIGDDIQQLLLNESLSPNQLLSGMAGAVTSVAPDARVVFTGDFVKSVQDRFDAKGVQVAYGIDRGANTVIAKTMRTVDGMDVVINVDVLFIDPDTAPQDVHSHVLLLLHTALHEGAHAQHHRAEEDSEATFNAMGIRTSADNYYAIEAGTIIEEFRAELAAEKQFPLIHPYIESLYDDLESLSVSLSEARAASRYDVPTAARIVKAAGTNFWKALSLAAAHCRATGASLPEVITSSPLWQRYGATLWDKLTGALQQLPDPGQSAQIELLQDVTREVMDVLPRYFVSAGVRLGWDPDGDEYMFWN